VPRQIVTQLSSTSSRAAASAARDHECDELDRVAALQRDFSLIKVKVLLVSLLNGFRDLTLMGVQAFDFNHLNNVLISRDYRKARLIDIDGASKGSIQSCTPTELEAAGCDGQAYFDPDGLHKPALEVDLSLLLPLVVQQLLLGKGRGIAFVNEQISSMRRAPSEDAAKALIYAVVCENFPELCTPVARREASSQATAGFAAPGPAGSAEDAHARGSSRHATKLVDWFYAMVMKRGPWTNWTNDIYDAMRCIDHLPIR